MCLFSLCHAEHSQLPFASKSVSIPRCRVYNDARRNDENIYLPRVKNMECSQGNFVVVKACHHPTDKRIYSAISILHILGVPNISANIY